MFDDSSTSNVHASAIEQLSEMLFVFHAWQNLSIITPDGAMFNLNTRALDVDGENLVKSGEKVISGGLGHLKRLRLLPITATQRPKIDNINGFSVTNVFVGNLGADGQPVGMGSSLSGSPRTTISAEWSYPGQKLADMKYTFGKYGLVGVSACKAWNAETYAQCQRVFRVVMAGIDDRTLLEDLPEYFGEQSLYLPDKRPARFTPGPAQKIIDAAANGGIEIGGKSVTLNEAEYNMAVKIIKDLAPSVVQAHTAALDPEANGILAQTREGLQTGQKRSYDKSDQWLMREFPSFPMDTELEKSNKQLMRALDDGPRGQEAPPQGFVSMDDIDRIVSEKVNAALEAATAPQEQPIPAATAAIEG